MNVSLRCGGQNSHFETNINVVSHSLRTSKFVCEKKRKDRAQLQWRDFWRRLSPDGI